MIFPSSMIIGFPVTLRKEKEVGYENLCKHKKGSFFYLNLRLNTSDFPIIVSPSQILYKLLAIFCISFRYTVRRLDILVTVGCAGRKG